MRLLPPDPRQGWTRLVWLIYAGALFMQPIFERPSALSWAATLIAVAVFLPLYFWGYWLSGRRELWIVAAIFALGVALAPLNPFSNCFVIYAAAFLGRVGRPRFAFAWLGGLELALALASLALRLRPEFWAPAAVMALVIGGVNIHFAETARANALLLASRQENEKLAQIAERERIARDLHDLLGHTLSLITLKAELAARLLPADPERAGVEIREVERISRETLREVRSAVAGYRSEGLAAELARARLALESAGIEAEYFTMPVELSAAAESALALALREAVTNVIRHAGARRCAIALEQGKGMTRLEVRDDGRGGGGAEGTGISVMRERIAGLGGTLERRGEPGAGTTIAVSVPSRPAGGGVGRMAEAAAAEAPRLPAVGLAPERAR